jgi:hypothetical protein
MHSPGRSQLTRRRLPLCYADRDHEIEIEAVPIAIIYLATEQGTLTKQVCRRHLDHWLDIADDQPEWEPSAVVWIR